MISQEHNNSNSDTNNDTSTVSANTHHKDNLFRLLFKDKNNLLSLYNALNSTSYTDPDLIEVTTIDNFIYMEMKNDVSLIKIPTPRYVVFYNGKKPFPESKVLKLSDAFFNQSVKGCMEDAIADAVEDAKLEAKMEAEAEVQKKIEKASREAAKQAVEKTRKEAIEEYQHKPDEKDDIINEN